MDVQSDLSFSTSLTFGYFTAISMKIRVTFYSVLYRARTKNENIVYGALSCLVGTRPAGGSSLGSSNPDGNHDGLLNQNSTSFYILKFKI